MHGEVRTAGSRGRVRLPAAMQISTYHTRPGSTRAPHGSPAVERTLPPPDFPTRRRQTLARMRRSHPIADSLAICDPLDIQYLTGTRHGISWLILHAGGCFAISRHMLVEEVRAEAVDCEILLPCARSTERPDLEKFLLAEMTRRGCRSLLIDPARLAAQSYLNLIRHAEIRDIPVLTATDFLACQRAIKDATELELIRRCVGISETAFEGLTARGCAGLLGRTEREIADELETRMWSLGADRQGFPETGIIVASGPNSASAHHSPGGRRVAAGEPLLLDWGAELSGYRSDMTRTLFLGSLPDFAREAYPVVEKAIGDAARLLQAGQAMGEIDRAARDVVTGAGYTEFHYGVGHGVGLAIHETPWLRARSEEICEVGMVTTIEPGVYLTGVGGIRIENLYRIGKGGCECLNSLPIDLESMVLTR